MFVVTSVTLEIAYDHQGDVRPLGGVSFDLSAGTDAAQLLDYIEQLEGQSEDLGRKAGRQVVMGQGGGQPPAGKAPEHAEHARGRGPGPVARSAEHGERGTHTEGRESKR